MRKIEKKSVDVATFDIPADYTRREMGPGPAKPGDPAPKQ
jgi:hypothetical protein